jgi:hypothetical protein
MALTETEKEAVRYYCGYGMYGLQALPASGYRFSIEYGTLEYKMINLQPGEEDRVRDQFLAKLAVLDEDTYDVRDNIDTDQAAVWYHNKQEIPDRVKLFNYWRLKLCAFLGIPPGEGLFGGAVSLAV